MEAEFRAPRRRTRVQEEFMAPFPVSRIPEDGIHFRAQIINKHVLVCDPDHIQQIYNQGFFGKGVLSRARPDHSISDQWEQHEGLFLPVVSQTRYEELLRWAGSALSAQGLDEEAVSQTLFRLSQPLQMEDVRREMGGRGGGGGTAVKEEEEPGAEGGVCQLEMEVEPETKRSCGYTSGSGSHLTGSLQTVTPPR